MFFGVWGEKKSQKQCVFYLKLTWLQWFLNQTIIETMLEDEYLRDEDTENTLC